MVVCLRGCIWFSWIFLFPAPGEAAIALLPLRNGGSPSEGALPPPADKEQTCPTPSSLFYRDSERAARRTKPGVWTGDSAPSLLPFTESPGRGGGIPEAFVQAANALQKAALECSFEVSLPSGPCDSLCAHGGGRVLPALRPQAPALRGRREAPGNPISRKVTLSARKHLGRYRLESNEGDSAG